MSAADSQLVYSVPGVGCGHCRDSIVAEVEQVAGVSTVEVDLDAKRVEVSGAALDDGAVRAAVAAAGYEVAP
jgi:copper chaperone